VAIAGFPCQDLSLAGQGAGLSGDRSGVFWSFARLIRDLRDEERAPTVVLLENVVGLLTSKGGQDFVALCVALNDLGYRSSSTPSISPHNRGRAFSSSPSSGVMKSPPTSWARGRRPISRRRR
jgi:site-specific DNA-cytosine methylase